MSVTVADVQDLVIENIPWIPSSGLIAKINNAVTKIAGGIRMPNGMISSPLPELMKIDTLTTTTEACVALPSDYQRAVFQISNSDGYKIESIEGVGYYDFRLFLEEVDKKDLSEAGTVKNAVVHGNFLYYQGIPAINEILTIMFYRKPINAVAGIDVIDGIPEHLSLDLIGNYVSSQLLKDKKEGEHYLAKFWLVMDDLISYIDQINITPI